MLFEWDFPDMECRASIVVVAKSLETARKKAVAYLEKHSTTSSGEPRTLACGAYSWNEVIMAVQNEKPKIIDDSIVICDI